MNKIREERVADALGASDSTKHVEGNADEKQAVSRPEISDVETRPAESPYKRIHIIINPAAGQEEPVLSILNRVFQAADVEWHVHVTKQGGDAERFAREAVAAGADCVAVYGGDGTQMEAAAGLAGSDVPLAILPGGTANVLSIELGIPGTTEDAAAMITSKPTMRRWVDVGEVNGQRFILRVGLGLEAQMVEGADREKKERMGVFAYALSALQALRDPQPAHYDMTIDGQNIQSEGLSCIITNVGSLGQPGLNLPPTVDVSDGRLDVFVIRQADLASVMRMLTTVVVRSEPGENPEGPLQHWQGRQITIVPTPLQSLQVDGEVQEPSPIDIKVIPRAVQIVVPAA
ncbi:MAG: diacylglycerol kinase family protein [Anaerolineae bacterium]